MMNRIKRIISSFFIPTEYTAPHSRNLQGTVVVITGASRGVGRAVAEVLQKQGASLAVISRNRSDLDKAYTDDKNVLLVTGDISREQDVKRMIAEIYSQFGHIDVLVNNAGSFLDKALDEVSEKEYDTIMATNVKGAFLMNREVLHDMKRRKQGFIVNIGSKISHNTNVAPKKVMYATTKYALEGFSFALNKELKPFGVRVTCLMPGTINTFVSLKSKSYLSPYDIGETILFMIRCKTIDFESIVMKCIQQDL